MISRKLALLLIILAAGVGLDAATKLWVMQTLPLGAQISVLDGVFNLVHVQNRGAAFGILANWSPALGRGFFIFTTVLVIAVVAYLWWRLPRGLYATALGYSFILAGALGNLIDRVRLGVVVDFLDFYWGRYHWPAFNVADSLVCLGAALLVGAILTEGKDADVSRAA